MHPSHLPGNTDYLEINTGRLHAQNAEQPRKNCTSRTVAANIDWRFCCFQFSSSVLERNVIISNNFSGLKRDIGNIESPII